MEGWTEHADHEAGALEVKYAGSMYDIPTGEQYKTPKIRIGNYQWMVQMCHEVDSVDARKSVISVELLNASDCEVTADFTVYVLGGNERASDLNELMSVHGASIKIESGYPIVYDPRLMRLSLCAASIMFGLRFVFHSVEGVVTCRQRASAPFIEGRFKSAEDVCPTDVDIVLANDASAASEVAESSIPAHKYVLALHSPVFRAMFQSSMQEAHSNAIAITDFIEPVVRAFIRFLYEDRCARDALQEHGPQLLLMADKYEVRSLFDVCEHFLALGLTAANAVERAVLAEMCGATTLKAKALSFISSNQKAVAEQGCTLDLSASLLKDLLLEMANGSAQQSHSSAYRRIRS